MKAKRCIAFRQSQDFPELLMPCTEPVLDKQSRRQGRFCREHERAYREIVTGILNEACQHKPSEAHP